MFVPVQNRHQNASPMFMPLPPYTLFDLYVFYLPAWWALQLLWWTLTKYNNTYGYVQIVSVTVTLLYSGGNKTYNYNNRYYYYSVWVPCST